MRIGMWVFGLSKNVNYKKDLGHATKTVKTNKAIRKQHC